MLSQDPTEAGDQLERFAQDLQRKAQRYTQLQQQLDSASVTERSTGGEVTVTVDANGVLTRLDLSERTRGMDPAALSAQIMSCQRRAQARLREQVSALVHETVGDDAAGANIVNQYTERFPDPVEDDAAPQEELPIGLLADESAERRTEPRRPGQRPLQRDDEDEDPRGGSILR